MNNHPGWAPGDPWIQHPSQSVPAGRTMVLDHGRLADYGRLADRGGPLRLISTVVLLVLGYYFLNLFNTRPSRITRLCCKTFVYLIPSQVIYALQRMPRKSGRSASTAEAHSFQRADFGDQNRKAEILQGVLEKTMNSSLVQKLRSASGIDKVSALDKELGPPGLGNYDNSCYQNSILQGFGSLPAFQAYLERSFQFCNKRGKPAETHEALTEFLSQLNDTSLYRSMIWTPHILKSMDSREQQDAQEYFSKVIEAVEKETIRYSRILKRGNNAGLECLVIDSQGRNDEDTADVNPTRKRTRLAKGKLLANEITPDFNNYNSPMNGMLAQKLQCQVCGYSEGFSQNLFNCLTVNMGMRGPCSIEDLLDEYTEPEYVEGVECTNCTKLAAKVPLDASTERTQKKKRSVPTKPVLRTKAKQITVGKLPKDLVIHINRSVIDDFGAQLKNRCSVQFPAKLDFMGQWCIPLEAIPGDVQASYHLRCVVTHSGEHNDGHYVAFRKCGKNWYSVNDEVVRLISEEDVLARGNAFMLFYEAVEPFLPPILRQLPLNLSNPPEKTRDASSASSSSQASPCPSPSMGPKQELALQEMRTAPGSASVKSANPSAEPHVPHAK